MWSKIENIIPAIFCNNYFTACIILVVLLFDFKFPFILRRRIQGPLNGIPCLKMMTLFVNFTTEPGGLRHGRETENWSQRKSWSWLSSTWIESQLTTVVSLPSLPPSQPSMWLSAFSTTEQSHLGPTHGRLSIFIYQAKVTMSTIPSITSTIFTQTSVQQYIALKRHVTCQKAYNGQTFPRMDRVGVSKWNLQWHSLLVIPHNTMTFVAIIDLQIIECYAVTATTLDLSP